MQGTRRDYVSSIHTKTEDGNHYRIIIIIIIGAGSAEEMTRRRASNGTTGSFRRISMVAAWLGGERKVACPTNGTETRDTMDNPPMNGPAMNNLEYA